MMEPSGKLARGGYVEPQWGLLSSVLAGGDAGGVAHLIGYLG